MSPDHFPFRGQGLGTRLVETLHSCDCDMTVAGSFYGLFCMWLEYCGLLSSFINNHICDSQSDFPPGPKCSTYTQPSLCSCVHVQCTLHVCIRGLVDDSALSSEEDTSLSNKFWFANSPLTSSKKCCLGIAGLSHILNCKRGLAVFRNLFWLGLITPTGSATCKHKALLVLAR